MKGLQTLTLAVLEHVRNLDSGLQPAREAIAGSGRRTRSLICNRLTVEMLCQAAMHAFKQAIRAYTSDNITLWEIVKLEVMPDAMPMTRVCHSRHSSAS